MTGSLAFDQPSEHDAYSEVWAHLDAINLLGSDIPSEVEGPTMLASYFHIFGAKRNASGVREDLEALRVVWP